MEQETLGQEEQFVHGGVAHRQVNMYLVFLNILINTGYREKLFVKCKLLKKDGLIKDVFTERGDIKVMGDILSINQPKLCKVSKYQFYVQSLYACRIFFHHFEALKMK